MSRKSRRMIRPGKNERESDRRERKEERGQKKTRTRVTRELRQTGFENSPSWFAFLSIQKERLLPANILPEEEGKRT